MASLLVTNDFPPKVGGIQSYLWELWRRLPPGEVTVLTTPHPGAAAFDAAAPFRIERTAEPVLLPTPRLARRIDLLATEIGADVVFVDPALPLGLVGPHLRVAPYVVIVHGAEVTVPGRVPLTRPLLRRVLRHAAGMVAAGGYPAAEAHRAAGRPLAAVTIPPGVDTERFRPLSGTERAQARERLGLGDGPLVVGVSRLVPRKGFDTLIDAVRALDLPVQLAVAGAGRDRARLERRCVGDARVRLLGKVPEADLPALYGCADVFAMCCRDRWAGLEAEGFGIVFLEAGAAGVPSVAGRSGGSDEAVADGETGYVVDGRDTRSVAGALRSLLTDPDRRQSMGSAGRRRAVAGFSYDVLATRLAPLAAGDLSVLT